MLLLRGRDSELGVLRGLLADAVESRSGVLVVRGEVGIGKSALLDVAVSTASGFVVLAARGVQSESEIAFAGLQELCGPVLGLVERLPGWQRAVLAGALALGPPVPGDPLAVRAATLSLLAIAAEAAPLLVVVDDAQWLDPASAEALAFAARRLDSERTVALFAVRDGEPSAFDHTGLRELNVPGLDESSAREVLADRSSQAIANEVTESLLTLAGGNPLALLELPAALNERSSPDVSRSTNRCQSGVESSRRSRGGLNVCRCSHARRCCWPPSVSVTRPERWPPRRGDADCAQPHLIPLKNRAWWRSRTATCGFVIRWCDRSSTSALRVGNDGPRTLHSRRSRRTPPISAHGIWLRPPPRPMRKS
jgi:hypothetical protein